MNLRQMVITAAAAAPLAIGTLQCGNLGQQNQTAAVQGQQDEDSLRNAVLGYLSQPKFSNADLMEQITGTAAKLQMLDLDEKTLYLSLPAESYTGTTINQLSSRPELVEFGQTSSGEFVGANLVLGGYVLNKPGHYFLRFPSGDFKIDSGSELLFRFPSADYSLSLGELQGFIGNRSIYGGPLRAITGTDGSGRNIIIANHGALVARKGESSLERLVSSLVPQSASRERAAQVLLDFVTSELRYDESDAIGSVEVLKRPNEVLMTGGSDCSGKVILYASLLEQTGIDYRLVYLDSHITIGIQGEYAHANDMGFNLGEQMFSIAETTVPRFRIGRTRLRKPLRVEDFRCIQRPGDGSVIYDAKTGSELRFQ